MTPDALKWILEHAAEAYDSELRQTEKLKERVSFTLSLLLTPVIGVAVYLIGGLKGELLTPATIAFFWLPVGLSIVAILLATFHLACVLFRRFEYKRTPFPSEIAGYLSSHPDPAAALNDAQNGLLKQYALCIDHNFQQNQIRVNFLLRAQRAALFAALLLGASLPEWIYSAAQAPREPQTVKIVAPIEIMKEKPMTTPATPSGPAVTPSAPAPTQNAAPASPPASPPASNTPNIKPPPPFPQSRTYFDAVEQLPPFEANKGG